GDKTPIRRGGVLSGLAPEEALCGDARTAQTARRENLDPVSCWIHSQQSNALLSDIPGHTRSIGRSDESGKRFATSHHPAPLDQYLQLAISARTLQPVR